MAIYTLEKKYFKEIVNWRKYHTHTHTRRQQNRSYDVGYRNSLQVFQNMEGEEDGSEYFKHEVTERVKQNCKNKGISV